MKNQEQDGYVVLCATKRKCDRKADDCDVRIYLESKKINILNILNERK